MESLYVCPDLQSAYGAQQRAAKRRGIGWQLTYEQWLTIWTDSGHLHERGCKAGQYVMARVGDVGPYSQQNVFIQLHSQNVKDGFANGSTRARRLGLGRGWTITKSKTNPYQVMCGGKRVGNFPTQAEAEAAYVVAVEKKRVVAHDAHFFTCL